MFLFGVSQKCYEILQKNFMGVSATKSWENSRNFRYGSNEDFLSKGQKIVEGGGLDKPTGGNGKVAWLTIPTGGMVR